MRDQADGKNGEPTAFKLALFAVGILTLAGLLFWFLRPLMNLPHMQALAANWQAMVQDDLVYYLIIFVLAYILLASLSVPGTALLSLLSGALFGFPLGLLASSFASCIGASIAFLLARWFIRDFIAYRFADQLQQVNRGFANEGEFYLFALRMVPAVPFFVVNTLMGLTSIRLRSFYGITQLALLPSTALLVYAGTEISKLTSLNEVWSGRILALLAALGLMPILLKRLVLMLRSNASH